MATASDLLELFGLVTDERSGRAEIIRSRRCWRWPRPRRAVPGLKEYTAIAGHVKHAPPPVLAHTYLLAGPEPVRPPSTATI